MVNMLTYAIELEKDGEKYYLEQAEKNKGNSMNRAFILLAQAENKHAELLTRKLTVTDKFLFDERALTEPANLFSDKSDYKRDAERVPEQLEVYVFALDMEEKSIELYKRMLAEASDEPTKDLMNFLISKEQDHYDFFDELITLLKKPRDWVENAEFSPDREY